MVGVAPDLAAVHFADDVTDVQHALPVDGAAVQDPRDHHFSPLRAERHPLKEGTCHFHHAEGGGAPCDRGGPSLLTGLNKPEPS